MKYEIKGEPTPVVICELSAGESMITEKGSMVWMSPNMEMQTSAGGLGKAFGRMFSGESIFQNIYTAQGGPGMIAFASSFPGAIRAVEITPDRPIVVQKSAFLAATDGVELSVFFQKKLGAGFFGGEGLLLERLSGRGMAFLELDGSVVEKNLAPGEVIKVSTGNVAAWESSVSYSAETVRGFANIFFGGEGLFLTVLQGPGKVWLQTINMADFAGRILPYLPARRD